MKSPKNHTYLDYNASSPVLPKVADEIYKLFGSKGNPSSVHASGRFIRSALEESREYLARYLNTQPNNIIFTSGATEANAMVIKSVMGGKRVSKLYCSSIEHPSVLNNVPQSNLIPVDSNGIIDLVALENILNKQTDPILLCLMFANNETGVIQPIKKVSQLIHSHGSLILSDSAQAFGRLKIDMEKFNLDFVTLSAHKFGALPGAGALVVSDTSNIEPLYFGGGQENYKRPGSENVHGIISLGMAVRELPTYYNSLKVEKLRNRFEKALKTKRPDSIVFGSDVERLPNTTCVALEGASSESQIIKLDLAGYAVSAGSACSSGKITASHVLLAMGIERELASCAIRVSIGPLTVWEELEGFLDIWSCF